MKTTITIKGIDKDVWLSFRALCVKEEKNVGDKLNELMAKAVEREG